MRSLDLTIRLFLVLLLALSGCSGSLAPKGWSASPDNARLDAYGAWIDVERGDLVVSGELLAVQNDSLFLATPEFRGFAQREFTAACVTRYDAAGAGAMVLGGVLFSLSNGLLAVFTIPMWLIGGSISAAARSGEPLLRYPSHKLEEFRPYARYPQGLPDGVDRKLLVAKRLQ